MPSEEVAAKLARSLGRFVSFFTARYGDAHLSRVLPRDVRAWQDALTTEGLAPSTINVHLSALSGFCTWVTCGSCKPPSST